MTPVMNTSIQLLLQEGEGYQTEFKESLSNLTKSWSPSPMRRVGTILLGVRDDGTVKNVGT